MLSNSESWLQADAAKTDIEKQKLAAKKELLRMQRAEQLQDAIARKLAVDEAMTKTEREINADTLRRMHAAQQTIKAWKPKSTILWYIL